MQKIKEVFSSFSVDDADKCKEFYTETLGLTVEDGKMGLIIKMQGGGTVFAYPKGNHEPAMYTVLNIEVEDIDATVDELTAKGVEFERYDGMDQDEKGISRGHKEHEGPSMAWLKDPAGNIMGILQR